MKYYGKEKCRILKEIRAEIARQNGIAWTVEPLPGEMPDEEFPVGKDGR